MLSHSPASLKIEAHWPPMTEEEIDRRGLRSYVGYPVDYEDGP
jgi:hypothetical protein